MALQIYNTLTRRKEPFKPLDPPNVTIYCCGPTVYERFHVGNARPFVFIDIVRRYFEYKGYHVKFVQNLTDIDDKIINRANEEGCGAKDITDHFIPAYFEDAAKLRIGRADVHPKATDHLPEIIDLIKRLIDKGLAYEADGSVYFGVREYKEYGKLSGRRIDDLLEGARVEVNEAKRDPADFAMWKAAKPGEPIWDSPWGPGRPGWHIECSAMAMKHLGETFDIHAGGNDLIFPHHENEIAQSEGATGQPFARTWMHNGFLNLEGAKMSKSEGNVFRIDKILERASPAAVRHFLISAHYRSPLDLTDTTLGESAAAVGRINDAIETGLKLLELEGREPEPFKLSEEEALRRRFEADMEDDFNTPRALALMFDVVGTIHELRADLARAGADKTRLLDQMAESVAFAAELRDFFGLEEAPAGDATGDGLTEPLINLLIEARNLARQSKDFQVADRIRVGLSELGIFLEDHPQGTIWRRKET